MTNAKRQKKFRDKMREIKNSPYTVPVDEVIYTERSTGACWRLFKIWNAHDHFEIAKITMTNTPRVYRKTRVVSSNVLNVNYVRASNEPLQLAPLTN